MAAKKTALEEASSKILVRQGKKETEWKKEVIEKAQFAFFKGQDKELEQFIINRARTALVYKEIK